MSQYLQFRSWLRSSSAAEKKLVVSAAVIVLGLFGWALVPTGGPGGNAVAVGAGGGAGSSQGVASAGSGSSSQASGASGGVAGSQGAAAAGSSSGAGSGTAAAAGTAGSSASGTVSTTPTGAAAAGCGTLTKTDTGVSATQINVADILLNLAGAIGNSAVGQSSPQVQQQMAQAVVDDINSHGGVDCRKLVVTYYQANPIDPTSTQNICLQIQQAGVFAVMGGFAYPESANDCLAQQ